MARGGLKAAENRVTKCEPMGLKGAEIRAFCDVRDDEVAGSNPAAPTIAFLNHFNALTVCSDI